MQSNDPELLKAFLAHNPDYDFTGPDFLRADRFDWGEIDRGSVLSMLRRAGRLRGAADDPLIAHQISMAGYDSLFRIARRSRNEFIRDTRARIGEARSRLAHGRARGAWTQIAHRWMRMRERLCPHNRAMTPAGASVETDAASAGSVYYESLFGEAPVTSVPDEMSIFGPGAYFMDLMNLIEQEITVPNQSAMPPALTLRSRRPDLWNLPLSRDNIDEELSYADLTRRILESTLLQLAPPIPQANLPATTQSVGGRTWFCAGYDELKNLLTDTAPPADGDLIVVTPATGDDFIAIPSDGTLTISSSVTLKAGSTYVAFDCSLAGAFDVAASNAMIQDFIFQVPWNWEPAITAGSGNLSVENCLFVTNDNAPTTGDEDSETPGWALTCTGTEINIKNCTFVDDASTGFAWILKTADSTVALFLNSILRPTYSTRMLSIDGSSSCTIEYCDVHGGDPGDSRVAFGRSNFDADPLFLEGDGSSPFIQYLRVQDVSPCIGRGSLGANVGAAPYDLYGALRRAMYPFDLPFSMPFETARLTLDGLATGLPEIFKKLEPFYGPEQNEYAFLSALGLSIPDFNIIQTPENDASKLAAYYGLTDFSDEAVILAPGKEAAPYLFATEDFARITGLTLLGLRELVYQDLRPAEIARGVQAGNSLWAHLPASPWTGFFVNAGESDPALALFSAAAPVGRGAVSFSGAGATMKLAGTAGEGWTMSCWLFPADANASGTVLQLVNGDSNFSWTIADGTMSVKYGTRVLSDVDIADYGKRWVRVTNVYDSSDATLTVYLNDLKTEEADATGVNLDWWPDAHLFLALDSEQQNALTCSICEMTFFASVKSAGTIAADFQKPVLSAPSTEPNITVPDDLVGYWPMNDYIEGTNEHSGLGEWSGKSYTGVIVSSGWIWGLVGLPAKRGEITEGGVSLTMDGLLFAEIEVLGARTDDGPTGVGLGNLDRVNRFTRLSRRMSWSFADLDWALFTIRQIAPASGDSSLGEFRLLTELFILKREMGVSVGELCALFGYLKPFGAEAGSDDLSLFDIVYNRPPAGGIRLSPTMEHALVLPLEESDPALIREAARDAGPLARRLAAALGLEVGELARLTAVLGGEIGSESVSATPGASTATETTLNINWSTLTYLFRARLLMLRLNLGVTELLDLLNATKVNCWGDELMPGDMFRVLDASFLGSVAGVRPVEWQYLIGNPAGSIDPPGDPYQEALRQSFRNQLPELSDALRSDLSSLLFGPYSMTRTGAPAPVSAAYYEVCREYEYIDEQGIVTSRLLAQLPGDAFHVPADFDTIEDALVAAGEALETGAPSALVLLSPGVYEGEGNTGISFAVPKGELIVQSEAGPDSTIINGGSSSAPALTITGGGAFTLNGMTYQNFAPTSGSSVNGTVYCGDTPRVTIRNCLFIGNAATNGGGIYLSNVAGAQIINSVLYSNQVTGNGGGVYALGSDVSIAGTTLYENQAQGAGTGIYIEPDAKVGVLNSILWDPMEAKTEWAGDGEFTAAYSDLYTGNGDNPFPATCLSEDPNLAAPEYGNFAVGKSDDDPLMTCAADGGVPGYRVGFTDGAGVAYGLFPFAYSQLAALGRRLAGLFSANDAPLSRILRYLGPVLNGLTILTRRITDESEPANEDGVAYLGFVQLYLMLANGFNLDAREMEMLLSDPELFSLSPAPERTADEVEFKDRKEERTEPAGMGDPAVLWRPTSDDLETLARYKILKQEYPDYRNDILRYLEQGASETVSRASITALADLFNWNQVAITELLTAYETNQEEPSPLTTILDISRVMNLVDGTGLSIAQLRSLFTNGFMFGAQGALPLLQSLETFNPEEAARVRDQIAEMKRDIVKLLAIPLIDGVTRPSGFRVRDENELSDYLLIDTAMSACADTSRVVQATLSLQQYVSRCLLGLEQGVTTIDLSREHWDWMSTYRTWEANRRVFVYPENYIRPELRDWKTPLFEEAQHAVESGELTGDRADEIFTKYLEDFAVLANLQVVGACRQDRALIQSYGRWIQAPDANETDYSYCRLTGGTAADTIQFTAECLLRFSLPDTAHPGARHVVIGRRSGGGFNWLLNLGGDGSIFFDIAPWASSSVAIGTSEPLSASVWYHVAAVFQGKGSDDGYARIYINGCLNHSITVDDVTTIGSSNSDGVWMGGLKQDKNDPDDDKPDYGIPGAIVEIAEVRVYHGLRTQSEIAAGMFRPLTDGEIANPDLHAYFPLLQDFNDVIGNYGPASVTPDDHLSVTLREYESRELRRKSLTDACFLVGRTGAEPYQYYHRSFQTNRDSTSPTAPALWTPWLRIPLNLNAEFVSPLRFDGRLFIFWVEISAPGEVDGDYSATINCSVLNADDQWRTPRVLAQDIPIPDRIIPQTNRAWNDVYVLSAYYAGAPAILVIYGDYTPSAVPYCFVLRPDLSIVAELSLSSDNFSGDAFQYAAIQKQTTRPPEQPPSHRLRAVSHTSILTANSAPRNDVVATTYWNSKHGFRLITIEGDGGIGPEHPFTGISYYGDVDLQKDQSMVLFQNLYYFTFLNKESSGTSHLPLYTSDHAWGENSDWALSSTDISAPYADMAVSPLSGAQLFVFRERLCAVFKDNAGTVYFVRAGDIKGKLWERFHAADGLPAYIYSQPAPMVLGNKMYCLFSHHNNDYYPAYITCEWDASIGGNRWSTDFLKGLTGFEHYMRGAAPLYVRGQWYFAYVGSGWSIYIDVASSFEAEDAEPLVTIEGVIAAENSISPVSLTHRDGVFYCAFLDNTNTFCIYSSDEPANPAWTRMNLNSPDEDGNSNACGILLNAHETGASGPDIISPLGGDSSTFAVADNLGANVFSDLTGQYLVEAEQDGAVVNIPVRAVIGEDDSVMIQGAQGTDFTDVSTKFQFTRLQSGAARVIASILRTSGLDTALSPSAQATPEIPPAHATSAAVPPDDDRVSFALTDACGLYYRELFYFLPWFLAENLRENHRHREARRWLEYIFRPTGPTTGDDYWRNAWMRAITPLSDIAEAETIDPRALAVYHEDPWDATAIADLRPAAYQKALFMAYCRNLLDWGDNLFAANTRETINEASQLYRFTMDLLGPRPELRPYTPPPPETYAELSLRQENEFLVPTDPADPPVDAFDPNGNIVAYGFYFGAPNNPEFTATWLRVEDRLFKIRHCLSLTGEPNRLPLFAPPLDPANLSGGGTESSSAEGAGTSGVAGPLDPFTLRDVIFSARGLVQNVIEFGNSLLRALEMRDGETLAAMQAEQQAGIAEQLRRIRRVEVNEARANLQSLLDAGNIARYREQYYEDLLKVGQSWGEKAESLLMLNGLAFQATGVAFNLIAGIDFMIPQPVPIPVPPFVVLQSQVGMAMQSFAGAADGTANLLNTGAGLIGLQAGYQRRNQEWRFEKELAALDLKRLEAETDAARRRVEAAEAQYDLEDLALRQSREVESYYREKFTSAQLYSWMAGTLQTLHYQMYQIALAAARSVQSGFNATTARNEVFISGGNWDGQRKGLLAGESLLLDLSRLEQAFVDWTTMNPPHTQVVTHSIRKIAPRTFLAILSGGRGVFDLSEGLFTRAIPGHYLRIIEEIKIEFPGLNGETAHGELTQLSASLVRAPDPVASAYLMGSEAGPRPGASLTRGLGETRASFTIAGGDGGNLSALRGRPLIGRYRLALPPEGNRFDLTRIKDMVLRIRYRALHGGSDFAAKVGDALPRFREERLVDLDRLLRTIRNNPPSEQGREANFSISEKLFSRPAAGRRRVIRRAAMYALSESGPEEASVSIGIAPLLPTKAYDIPVGEGVLLDEVDVNRPLREIISEPFTMRLHGSGDAIAALRKLYLLLDMEEE